MIYSEWELKLVNRETFCLQHKDIPYQREKKDNYLPTGGIGYATVTYPRGKANKQKYKEILVQYVEKLMMEEQRINNQRLKSLSLIRERIDMVEITEDRVEQIEL